MKNLCDTKGSGLIFVYAVIISYALLHTAAFAADVDVYAEGAFTDTDLVVYVYADINTGPILSFGVKVNYPDDLTFSSATKNDAIWYFSDGTTNHPYMNPEDEGTGVVIIGGKLDTVASTAGVTGTRVLLGTVNFTHNGITDFSGVTLTYGRGDGTDEYKNFVGIDGTVCDGGGVGFDVEIRERGDANGDRILTTSDISAIRELLGGNDYVVFADCNDDGVLTNLDMFCVRNKI